MGCLILDALMFYSAPPWTRSPESPGGKRRESSLASTTPESDAKQCASLGFGGEACRSL
jgi:hypothetical protein